MQLNDVLIQLNICMLLKCTFHTLKLNQYNIGQVSKVKQWFSFFTGSRRGFLLRRDCGNLGQL